jgi:glycosyltransferase involved in cell wall biosynthesis
MSGVVQIQPVNHARTSVATAPRIAAVIPVFNGAHCVGKAIESVLAQTAPVDELIVIDDGSTDNTRGVVQSYGARVRYIYQPNAGLPAARNAGIRATDCEWIGFLDADDCWLPEKLAKQKRMIAGNPEAVALYADQYDSDSSGAMHYGRAIAPDRLWPRLRTRNCFSSDVFMARRDALLQAGGYNESLSACEDWDLYVRLYRLGVFVYVPEALAIYRVYSGSMSTNVARMLQNFERILEPTLLADLKGLPRWAWRRRARSTQLFRAALIARAAGDKRGERRMLYRSLLTWPSPFWEPTRFKAVPVAWSSKALGTK